MDIFVLNSKIRYIPNLFDLDLSGPDGYYTKRLIDEVPWKTMIWKTGRPLPRKVFRYDIINNIGIIDEILEALRIKMEMNIDILGCFLNFYENENHWLPFHKDQYGTNIISLSFGSTRQFVFQNTKSKNKLTFNLSAGDLIYFPEEVNKEWKHGIMKSKNNIEPRVNIKPRVNITIFTLNKL